MKPNSTALLYFSRQADSDAREKSWLGRTNYYKNQKLAKFLIEQSTKAVNKTGLPVFHFHEGNQEGSGFGERLANAFEELYNKGYQSVIAVGNDSPGISNLNWTSIVSDLEHGKNVIGKSIRGGAYLIGISAVNFQRKNFLNLPWQSGKLYTELFGLLKAVDREVVELEVSRDINTFFDLKKFLFSEVISSAFKSLIKQLLKVEEKKHFYFSPILINLFRATPLRAPPVY